MRKRKQRPRDTTKQLHTWAHSSGGSVHEPTKRKLGRIPEWTGEVDTKSVSAEELLATESYWEREGQFSLRVLAKLRWKTANLRTYGQHKLDLMGRKPQRNTKLGGWAGEGVGSLRSWGRWIQSKLAERNSEGPNTAYIENLKFTFLFPGPFESGVGAHVLKIP